MTQREQDLLRLGWEGLMGAFLRCSWPLLHPDLGGGRDCPHWQLPSECKESPFFWCQLLRSGVPQGRLQPNRYGLFSQAQTRRFVKRLSPGS